MKVLLRIGLCCLLACGLMAQRRGGIGAGGLRGGGAGIGDGFHGGVGIGGGLRGGFIGTGGFRGFDGGFRRPFGFGGLNGFGYWPGIYGFGYGGLGYWDYPYYDYPPNISTYPSYTYPAYTYNTSPNVTIVYPAQQAAEETGPVQPVMRTYDQYGQETQPAPSPGSTSSPPVYLIATRDQLIRAASAYWVDGATLHYVTLQHEEKQVPLDSVDRALSMQLNRERRVPFQLPQ
jgi:hypothetical protein